MAQQPPAKTVCDEESDVSVRVEAPELTLPKDGALRAIAEESNVSPVTGAGSVRGCRLWRRMLIFPTFKNEANVDLNCWVRLTDLFHSQPPTSQPFYSLLLSATQTGYCLDGAAVNMSRSLPPLEPEYTEAIIDQTVREAGLRNRPRQY